MLDPQRLLIVLMRQRSRPMRLANEADVGADAKGGGSGLAMSAVVMELRTVCRVSRTA